MALPGNIFMTPIGILMIEHRLIERMVAILDKELSKITKEKKVSPDFIDTAIDFIRAYADKNHHGKEEDIFFKKLLEKKITDEHKNYILELIQEHKMGRATIGRLAKAKEIYVKEKTSAIGEIVACIKWLIEFYPMHIKKEDKRFFALYREYLSEEEQDRMLFDFLELVKNQFMINMQA